jgi:hypothetical protein
MNISSV